MVASGNIVIMGSSVGGLRILDKVFDNLPPLRTSIVVIHQMARTLNHVAVDRLNKKSGMEVLLAENGMKLRDTVVYVAPPDLHLVLLSNTTIELLRKDRQRPHSCSADTTMTSLNPDDWAWIVGIILSGVGQDGAEGIRHIKSIGGVTIAQCPASSPVGSMPKAACDTGDVDLVLTPEQIKTVLIGLFGPQLSSPRSERGSYRQAA
jgi:two-component system chemotaxis response regulator CheB